MKIKYDRSANAAYIYLVSEIGPGDVKKEYHCDFTQVGGMINLDFDSQGRLIGIEVIQASKLLPTEAINDAEIIGRE
jgi:uncharacterized protein YuzE